MKTVIEDSVHIQEMEITTTGNAYFLFASFSLLDSVSTLLIFICGGRYRCANNSPRISSLLFYALVAVKISRTEADC
jgi:hypothetical protein